MAMISGKVLYDPERHLLCTNIGIPGVPVVLYDDKLGRGAVAITDQTGSFRFTRVPVGSYLVCEDYSFLRPGAPVVDFLESLHPMRKPTGGDPPFDAVREVLDFPRGADSLDSLTPNTVEVKSCQGCSSVVFFYDGPVAHCDSLSIPDPGSENLLTAADGGTFGSLPPGTASNHLDAQEPYPGITEGLTYQGSGLPVRGEYTVSGTLRPDYGHHSLSDHTTGQETGRMLYASTEHQADCTFFSQQVMLEPGAQYLFSAWVMNANRFAFLNPAHVALEVVDGDGVRLLESRHLLQSSFLPIWRRVGERFQAGAAGPAMVRIHTWGRDNRGDNILLDDVALQKLPE